MATDTFNETQMEDVGAISFQFGGSKRYKRFYEEVAPILGGFSGVWGFVATAGLAFHAEAKKKVYDAPENPWDGGDGYIDSVDATVENIHRVAMEDPNAVPGTNFSDAQFKWLRNLVVLKGVEG